MDDVNGVEITTGLNVTDPIPKWIWVQCLVLLSCLEATMGGQAEYVRVPFVNAEFALKVPDYIKTDEQVLFLSDILPTGYFAADIANVRPGDDVAVFGAGPVGYFAVMSCFLRGAARVFSIDHWPLI